MKKFQSSRRLWVCLALMLLFMTVAGSAAAGSDGQEYAVASMQDTDQTVAIVTAGALNVRTGPDASFRSIAVIYQGQLVNLLGRWATNNWVLIRLYNGTEGWVNSVYLQTSVPISQLPVVGGSPPPPEAVPPIAGSVAIVNTGALNVRSGPGPTYHSVAVVTSGQQLLLIGRNASATWVKVQLPNGVQGWVNVYYVRTSVQVVNLPVVDAAPPDASQAVGIVNTGAVNVRSGPGAQYNSTAVLNSGTTVSLIGRNADATWTKVRLSNGVEGWINSAYLNTNVSIWSLPAVESAPPENGAIVNVGALNVRYGPGTGFGAFAVVFRGQVVTLIGRSAHGTWAQVRIPNGAIGWVNSNYLISPVPYESLPVTVP
jgi:uncharacterized protein YgiM (DUF1202 family)